jgi:radical SAM-linked protein
LNAAAARHRYAVDFAVDGDIRFIAHNDMVRLFSRACARAELPVCYSAGFNPRLRLSLPFPRPVGQASDVERVLFDFRESVETDVTVARLQAQMPAGITIRGAAEIASSDASPPRWVRYRIHPVPADPQELDRCAALLLDSEDIVITRVRHRDGKSRTVDIRPFIDTIRVSGCELLVSVYITYSGSAAPAEVCRALGMEADAINHLVRRVEIQWHESQANLKPPH